MKSNSNNEELIRKNLKEIAKREGVPEEKVEEDILFAISLAMKSDDPKIKEFWKSIPCEGDCPTIDEAINYIIMNLPKKYS